MSISGLALTSSSLASSFSASRISCLRSSVASSFRSSASFWRTSAGISAGSSCTGRACSAAVLGVFFSSISMGVPPQFCVSGGRSSIGNTKMRRSCTAARTTLLLLQRTKPRLPSVCSAGTKRLKKTLCRSSSAKKANAAAFVVRSSRAGRSVLDYDPGPLSCVHLHKFVSINLLANRFYYSAAKKQGQP